jgi:hypothetical protein
MAQTNAEIVRDPVIVLLREGIVADTRGAIGVDCNLYFPNMCRLVLGQGKRSLWISLSSTGVSHLHEPVDQSGVERSGGGSYFRILCALRYLLIRGMVWMARSREAIVAKAPPRECPVQKILAGCAASSCLITVWMKSRTVQ